MSYPLLTHTSFPEVSIIGDLASAALGVGMAGSLAASEATYVADRLIAGVLGDPVPPPPVMAALCFVDTGRTGAAVACDFTGPASGTGPVKCVLLPPLAYHRRAKQLFASEWFATTVHGDGGWV